MVKDFVDGIDRIDFSQHAGVVDFGDLIVAQSGTNSEITLASGGADKITLAKVTATEIQAQDFVFA